MRRLLLTLTAVLWGTVASAQIRPVPGPVNSLPTVQINTACFNIASRDTYIARVGTNDLGIYTGATACAAGTLRFDVSATAVTSAVPLVLAQSASLNWTDVFARRSAAKTLTLDTDGAGGALTSVNLFAPLLLGGTDLSIQRIGAGIVQFGNALSPTGLTRLVLGTNDATANGFSLANNGGTIYLGVGNGSTSTAFRADAMSIGAAFSVKFNVSNAGIITTYNNVNTAALGMPAIYGDPAISAPQSANFTVLTQSPGATAGQWECTETLTSTSGTNTGTLQATVDYTDSQGTVHTGDIMFLYGANAAPAATQTGASKEWRTLPFRLTVNNANANIVLKVVITGTVAYTASGRCWQEATN